MLEKDVGLGENIKTLFREQGVTIFSILTAISLVISTIVASIVASVRKIPTRADTAYATQWRWRKRLDRKNSQKYIEPTE